MVGPGYLKGGDQSYAEGINDSGQVAGWSTTTEGPSYASLTGLTVKALTTRFPVDLPENVILTNAPDINNNGQVIATAAVIPERETYALCSSGWLSSEPSRDIEGKFYYVI